jgi:hypothetical protein
MKNVLLLICSLLMVGCVTTTTDTTTTDTTTANTADTTKASSSKTSKAKVGRSVTLNGGEHGIRTFTEEEYGPIESWVCRDRYSDNRTILFEVGHFRDKPGFGFVLYDGTSSGEPAMYRRTGIDRRWDWESGGGSYSFIIEPDGRGAYYDFTNVAEGETTPASSMYNCSKR